MAAAQAQAPPQLTDLEKLEHCLIVCGLNTATKRNGITVKEEIESLDEFARIRDAKGVHEMAKNLASRNTGAIYYSMKAITGMSALVYWLNDRLDRGLPLDHTLWTEAVRREIEEKMHVEENKEESNETVGDLKKFDPLQFEDCMADFTTLLHQKGLACLARDRNPPTTFVDDDHQRVHEKKLDSTQAKSDNKVAYLLFKQHIVDTTAWAWAEPFDKKQDFRGAWLAVGDYFNGPGELSKRVNLAKATLKDVYYKSETAFPFEKCSSKVMTAMAVLDKDPDQKMSEKQKVEFLQKTIRPSGNKLLTHVEMLASPAYSTNFTGALQHTSGQVSRTHASGQESEKTKKRRISELNTGNNNDRGGGRGRGHFGGRGRGRGRDGGRGRGRGRGRDGGRGRGGRHGGRGGRGQQVFFGDVGVTDPTRTFTNDEHAELQQGGHWPYILAL